MAASTRKIHGCPREIFAVLMVSGTIGGQLSMSHGQSIE